MSHSACSRLLITVTSDYKLADLYQVFSTWVVWTLMAPSVLVFPLSDTHESQIKHWIPFRVSIFLNTQSVAMLCHTVHHGIRAMHDSPIWFYIEMLSHDWSKWEQAEFTEKKKTCKRKAGTDFNQCLFCDNECLERYSRLHFVSIQPSAVRSWKERLVYCRALDSSTLEKLQQGAYQI